MHSNDGVKRETNVSSDNKGLSLAERRCAMLEESSAQKDFVQILCDLLDVTIVFKDILQV